MNKLSIAISLAFAFSAAAVAAPTAEPTLNPEARIGSGQAGNGTILVTHGKAAGRQSAAIDFQSDGNAFAFQFLLQLPKDAVKVDTGNCLTGLPSGFAGRCVAAQQGGKVAVVVYTTGQDTLPAGMLEIGQVSYSSTAKGGVEVDRIEVSSRDGKPLGVSAKVVGLD